MRDGAAQPIGVEVVAWVEKVHHLRATVDSLTVTMEAVEANIVRCPDPAMAEEMIEYIEAIRKEGNSVGGVIGSAAGLTAGFSRGRLDGIIMTLADAQLAFPFILLAIGIIAVLGPSFPTLVVVIGLSGWVSYARILRSQVLVVRSREFVESIHALGGSLARIVLRHVLPNVLSSIVVIATLELARAIVLEATLSFLGLGIQPPTPSWGGMVQEGREYLDSAWWISTFPGLVLMVTSIVVSRTGDWLRDVLDPTLRGE